jgi:hypothetical protein
MQKSGIAHAFPDFFCSLGACEGFIVGWRLSLVAYITGRINFIYSRLGKLFKK